MDSLGIKHVYQGQLDKLPAFEELLQTLSLSPEQVAYVGDDVVDLPILIRVGLAITVQDGHPLVKQHSHWTTPNTGGRAAARDVCELIMQAQGNLETQLNKYLQ
jgi:3-deoxy-D-manno-octulosonate 8-phosphate phosphatase (KDO 8-P phosphatase)